MKLWVLWAVSHEKRLNFSRGCVGNVLLYLSRETSRTGYVRRKPTRTIFKILVLKQKPHV